MSIAAALAELQRSPALPDHVAELQQFLAAEDQRRRRFHQDFEGRRGEFINGQIYVSPSATKRELDAITCVRNLLHNFVALHDLGEVLAGMCLVHCQRNDYEPDICFFGVAKAAMFTPDMLLFPPPDFAVEVVSAATADLDRKLKWQDYARHSVGEYWIVDPEARMVEQYVLPDGAREYALKARLAEGGSIASVSLNGFRVPVGSLFEAEENQRALLSLLNRG